VQSPANEEINSYGPAFGALTSQPAFGLPDLSAGDHRCMLRRSRLS
jgi:hypothetical protein